MGFPGTACARCSKRGMTCSHDSKGTSDAPSPSAYHLPSSARMHLMGDAVLGVDGISPAASSTIAEEPSEQPAHAFRANPIATPSAITSSSNDAAEGHCLNFSDLDLVCTIDADGISNRWLNPYVPAPCQKAKTYDPTVTAFIHRMLRSYASIAVHARGIPPFVHSLQLGEGVESGPLHTCLNNIRLYERTIPNDGTATDLLRQEMDRIFEQRDEYRMPTSLAAFQAYLLYSLVLYFWVSDGRGSIMIQPMMQLQELASITAKQGIACLAEQQHTRPKWEAWIVAEAARRAMYIMYLFDGLLSARDNIPSFLGTELTELPAPACQNLWNASGRQDWERRYNSFLAQWPEGYLTIDELWPAPQDFDESGVSRRQVRVDHWLEDVDKFGTMLFSVTSYIHKN